MRITTSEKEGTAREGADQEEHSRSKSRAEERKLK